ncbi:MAG: hypothetical protein ACXVS6_08500 [Solirubrobacteraceae bacterium]
MSRHVDEILRCANTGAIWSLRIGSCSAEERADLIDHHGRAAAALRARGYRLKCAVVWDSLDGECLTARILTGPAWSQTVDTIG